MINRPARFAAICIFLSAFSLAAQTAGPLIPAGDPRYLWLEDLSLAVGILPLLSEAPLPASRMAEAAREARMMPLPAGALAAVTGSFRALSGREPTLPFRSGSTDIGLDARIFLHPELELSSPDTAIPSPSGYGSRPPFFAADLDLGLGKSLALGARFSLESNPDALDQDLAPQMPINLPWDFAGYDFRQPSRSYAIMEGSFWNIIAGRQAVDWGPLPGGNIFLSSSAGSLDQAGFALSFPDLDYRFFAASLDAREEGFLGMSDGTPYDDIPRTLIAHRLNIRLWKKLRLALNEATMVGGIQPDLSQLNPISIFHDSFDYKHASVMLSAEAELLPWKYLSLNAGFAANQLQSEWEKTTYPAAAEMPDAYAWQAGAKLAIPAGRGFAVGRAFFSYANPWMYIREYPAISYSNEHYLGSNVPGSSQYDLPCLGMPLGPDSEEFFIEAGWRAPGRLSLLGIFRWTAKGEQYLDTPYATGLAQAALVTPTGTPEYTSVLGLEGAWTILEGLDLEAGMAAVWRANAGHVSGGAEWETQFRLGLSIEALSLGKAIRK